MSSDHEYYIESENNILKKSGVQLHYTDSNGIGNAAGLHIHESVELLYIIDGHYIVSEDRNKYELAEGDIIMLRSNALHSVSSLSEKPGRYLVIKIKPSVLLSMSDRDSGYAYIMRFVLHSSDKVVWTKSELEGSPIKAFADMLKTEHDTPTLGTDVIRKSAACGLLVSILRDDEANGRRKPIDTSNITAVHQIYKAINYISENYSENISALDCAAKVNMSYSYFSRIFKSITGKSFRTYLTEVRINHADKLMFLSDRSVTEIAMECGFNDVSYFIAQYKAIRGVTPHKYRKNM